MLKIIDYKGNLEAVAAKLDSRKESVNKEVNDIVLKIIEDINIFDVYEGEFLPVGFKSLAVAIKYSSLDRTLKDEDINPVEEKFISSLNNQYKVYLRS